MPRGVDSGVKDAFALLPSVAGKLDNQDRVFPRQTHHSQQPDLKEDPVFEPAQIGAGQGPQNADWHGEHHGKGDRPAFIKRRQRQEDRRQGQTVQQGGLVAGFLFLQGQTSPGDLEAGGQLGDQPFKLCNRLACADPFGGGTLDLHRGDTVIAVHPLRPVRPASFGKVREGHQPPAVIAHAPFLKIRRGRAGSGLALHIDPFDPPLIDKVVHIATRPRDGQQVAHIRGTDPHRTGAAPVDIQIELRRIFQPAGAGRGDQRALRRHPQKLVTCLQQLFVALTAAALQVEIKARHVAKLADRGWHDGEDHRILYLAEGTKGPPRHRLHALRRLCALLPVFQSYEDQTKVLPLARKAEAHYAEDGFNDVTLVFQIVVLDLFDDLERAFRRRPRGGLHQCEQRALILGRQEACGRAHEQEHHRRDDRQIDQPDPQRTPHEPADRAGIPTKCLVKTAVEQAKEPAPLLVAALLEQGRTKRGRQGQGDHHRQRHRRDDGDRELFIDHPRRAGEKRHRHKDRRQNHRDPDQGAGDLVHRLARRLKRADVFLLHDPFDVLDDHNRVIDEQANRQHHAQHRQRVDRKAKGREHAKGAQQDDRHRQRRDQGGADVLQEQIHDDKDQHDRLDQGLDHLFDRDFHEGRRIEGHDIAHPFGEERRQFLDPLFDGGGCIQRVGTGGKADRHTGRRIAVVARDRGIAFRPDLDPRDIIQQHQPAVGFRAQHDLAEILGAGQQGLRGDRGVQRLPFDGRTAAKGSR